MPGGLAPARHRERGRAQEAGPLLAREGRERRRAREPLEARARRAHRHAARVEPAQDLLLVFFAVSHSRTSFLIEIQSRKTSGVPHDNFGGAVGHRGLRADYATWGYAVGRGDAARRNRFAIAMGGVLRPGRPRSCGRASGTVRFRRAQASVRHGGHRRARARLALPRPDRGMCASFANRLRTLLSWNYGKRTGDRARTELWQRG